MRVFLSYNSRDRETADRLREALLRRRPDLDIYFAPVRNMIGAYWISQLGDELKAADAVLLLLGERVGAWQELEYYDALKRNRKTERPLIAPIALAETLPGLHFLDHFHRLVLDRQPFDDLVASVLAALDGAGTRDDEPLWRRTNPYRGLPAMRTEDSAYFFGREEITGEILEALRRRSDRVLALVGNSGVGKSSIAQAGVLAALRSRLWPGDIDRTWPASLETSPAWLPITITPGERPLKALAQGFARTWLDDPAEIEDQALKWVA
ncbi:MAG: TIR domain-containing protein, partial [Alphaproteobacteria bacterium]